MAENALPDDELAAFVHTPNEMRLADLLEAAERRAALAEGRVTRLADALEEMYDAFKDAAQLSVSTRQRFEAVAAKVTLAVWVDGT